MLTTSVPPRFHFVPEHTASAGQDCINLARYAGLELDPWQEDVLRGALALDPAERWAAMRVALLVPRQNGKGGILEALELFHLFAVSTSAKITHTAHRFDTCLEHFQRLLDLIVTTPELLARVDDSSRTRKDGLPSGIKDSNGKESIKLKDGSIILFKARENQGSGRGFSGDLVVFDEAYRLGDLSGLIPTMSARVNPQVWYTSSAPLPQAESNNLRRLVRTGRALAEGAELGPLEKPLTYFEWSAPADADLDDVASLRMANPSMEVGRITPEFTYGVERADLTPEQFARERFGIFPDDDDALWALFDEAAWTEGFVDDVMDGPPTYAVEVTPDRDRYSISVAGMTGDRLAVECGENEPFDQDRVIARLVDLHSKGWKALVIEPGSPAGTLVRPLSDLHGIDVHEVSTADYAKACQTFYDHHRGDLAHSADDLSLNAAVAAATKRKHPSGWLFNRDGRDVTPLSSAALARWGHLEIEAPPQRSIYEDREPLTL